MARISQQMCSNCTVTGCTFEVHIGELVHCPRKTKKIVQQKRENVDKTAERIKGFREQF